MNLSAQAPVLGSSFVTGMAQSYLIKKYPDWSWMLSAVMVAGGAMLATRPGMLQNVGLGIAASGASGMGVALTPVDVEAATAGRVRRVSAPIGSVKALGTASRYPAPARDPEFDGIRLR